MKVGSFLKSLHISPFSPINVEKGWFTVQKIIHYRVVFWIVTDKEWHNDRIICKFNNVVPSVIVGWIWPLFYLKNIHDNFLISTYKNNPVSLSAKTWGRMQLKAEEKPIKSRWRSYLVLSSLQFIYRSHLCVTWYRNNCWVLLRTRDLVQQ